jgi:heme exporter protein A
VAAPVVELRECSKRFGERLALRRVSLRIEPGETIALVGANGSGKSTLLRLVSGLARPTAGEALLDGVPAVSAPPALRGRIGLVAHRALSYRGLTARENLALQARLHRRSVGDVEPALDRVGLLDRADERIDGFSRGMTQRLGLARALLHEPDLLLLDEPATGLDADGQALLAEVIREGGGRRTTIFTTHDAGSLALAGRVVTLAGGSLA